MHTALKKDEEKNKEKSRYSDPIPCSCGTNLHQENTRSPNSPQAMPLKRR
jgi:hypothetical protein